MKFARDRRTWTHWLYEARRRFALCVLNYQVTSNHVHLLVQDRGVDAIARSMQLIAGCTGQAYNRRKRRRGAFWEDCYHATAVDTESYLARCLTYIDLNMVRAGVVEHPCDWPEAGYGEIQAPRALPHHRSRGPVRAGGRGGRAVGGATERVDRGVRLGRGEREPHWSEAVAVWRRSFVERAREELGTQARSRQVEDVDGASILREGAAPYGPRSGTEMAAVSQNSGSGSHTSCAESRAWSGQTT